MTIGALGRKLNDEHFADKNLINHIPHVLAIDSNSELSTLLPVSSSIDGGDEGALSTAKFNRKGLP